MKIKAHLICFGLALFTLVSTASAQCSFSCSDNLIVRHVAGTIAPVTDTITYGTVEYDGKCWITKNLGAVQQAASASDASDEAAGWYWQFNRKQGYSWNSTNSTRTPNTTWITSIDESSDWLAENDPCTLLLGSGWHIPTYSEFNSADVNGEDDIDGWDNYNESYASPLKLHAAGYIVNSTGLLVSRGGSGLFWTSTGANTTTSYRYYHNTDNSHLSNVPKSHAFSIRCCRAL